MPSQKTDITEATSMNNNDPANPYQAPEAPVYSALESRSRELVSGWRRLGTYLVDVVCFYLIFFALVLGILFVFGDARLDFMDGLAGNFIVIGFFLMYYIGFEWAFSRTPGKFALGTIVVDEKGNKPSAGQIVGRSFGRLIPFEALSCFGSKTRGWHDSLANTYVVRVS